MLEEHVRRGVTPSEEGERYGWLAGPLFAVAGLAALWSTHAPWPAIAAFFTVASGWTLIAWRHEIKQRQREEAAQEAEKTLVGLLHEFHTVLDQFTGCCSDQYSKGRRELDQLRHLLGDASNRLIGGVENLRGQVEAQQATLERLALRTALAGDPAMPTLDDFLPAGVSALSEVKAALDETLNETTTALQFEDLASQIVTHIDDRMEYLQTLLYGIVSIDAQLRPPPADATSMRAFYQERLVQIQRAVAVAAELIDRAEHVAVRQERLDAGEVELF